MLVVAIPILAAFTAIFSWLVPAALLGGLAVILFIRHPALFVWAVASYTVFEDTLQRWLPAETRYISEVAIMFMLVITLVRHTLPTGKVQYRRTPLELPLAIFLVVALASTLVNNVPPVVSLLGLRLWVRYIVLFYLVSLLDWPVRTQKRLIFGLLAVAVIEASLGLAQAVGGQKIAEAFASPDIELGGTVIQSFDPGLIGAKIFGTLGRYNRFGVYLMLLCLLGIAVLPALGRLKRRLMLAGLSVMLLALVLALSRHAWLDFAVGLGIIAIIDRRKLVLLAILIGATVMVIILFVSEAPAQSTNSGQVTPVERLVELFSPKYWQGFTITGGRVYYISVIGPRILAAAPLVGFGPGRFGSQVEFFYPSPVYAYLNMPASLNTGHAVEVQWVALLGQMGLLGLTAFLGMLSRLAQKAYRQVLNSPKGSLARSISLSLLAWTLAMFVSSFVGPNMTMRVSSMYYWLLAGLVCANITPLEHEAVATRSD